MTVPNRTTMRRANGHWGMWIPFDIMLIDARYRRSRKMRRFPPLALRRMKEERKRERKAYWFSLRYLTKERYEFALESTYKTKHDLW